MTAELKASAQTLEELEQAAAATEASLPGLDEGVLAGRAELARVRAQLAEKERVQGQHCHNPRAKRDETDT